MIEKMFANNKHDKKYLDESLAYYTKEAIRLGHESKPNNEFTGMRKKRGEKWRI